MDWTKAENWLNEVTGIYVDIGKGGLFALEFSIKPLRLRFQSGERTQTLYDFIMSLE